MKRFEGRNIVIVGAGSGIGYRLCVDLTAEGAEVYALGRTAHPELAAMGVKCFPYDALKPAVATPPPIPEAVHGLVYCPGTIRLAPFHRLGESDFTEDFNINVLEAVRAIQLCLGPLGKAGGASVVLFSTVAVRIGMGHGTGSRSRQGMSAVKQF